MLTAKRWRWRNAIGQALLLQREGGMTAWRNSGVASDLKLTLSTLVAATSGEQ
jgi:hypothetical protein